MSPRSGAWMLAAALVLVAAPVLAQSFTPGEERPEDYPPGPGREPVFYSCTACHGFKLVAQQGQTREQWDDTLTLMTSRHGMPPVDGELRTTVLDYLEAAFPPRRAPGGWQNPFIGK